MLDKYIVLDMEMTGLSPQKDKIIEIGAVKIVDGIIVDEYQTLINPNVEIRDKITDITGISCEDVKEKPFIGEVLQEFFQFIDGNILIGHSLIYDFSFLMQAAFDNNMSDRLKQKWFGIDTLEIAKKYLSEAEKKTLSGLCDKYGIISDGHHRALTDAKMTNSLYIKLCEDFEDDTEKFIPKEYAYKPKKERTPSKRELQYAEKLIKSIGIKPDVNIYKMSQSELSRYVDYIRLNQYSLQDNQ